METFNCPNKEDELMELPPGFRFHPTDEELITHYLSQKILDSNFCARAIGEVDLNKVEPWDLPWRAKLGEKEWYFFCVRDRKYPTGMRTNRATEAGYWKATGKDREIYKGKQLVGMKKTLVFYRGRAPKGEKTNWVMHEYRLEGKFSFPKSTKNDWVISRVFHKNSGGKKIHISGLVRMTTNLPPLLDCSVIIDSQTRNSGEIDTSHVTCFSNEMEDHKPYEDHTIDNTNFNTNSILLPPSSSSQISSVPPSDSFFYVPSNENFQYPYSFYIQNQNPKSEISQDCDPMASSGPVDLGSLWNY